MRTKPKGRESNDELLPRVDTRGYCCSTPAGVRSSPFNIFPYQGTKKGWGFFRRFAYSPSQSFAAPAVVLCRFHAVVDSAYFFNSSSISVSKLPNSLTTIAQIISSETLSYPWIILFPVSIIFLTLVKGKSGFTLIILFTASPIISMFLYMALFVFRSRWKA